MNSPLFALAMLSLVLVSCETAGQKSDAYGNFEATEVLVSAEGRGKLLQFNVAEGQSLRRGVSVGLIDTAQLVLQRAQLEAQREAVAARNANIQAERKVLEEQLRVIRREQERVRRLYADSAATLRQLDDVDGQARVIEKRIQAVRAQHAPIRSEVKSLLAQMAILNDQISKSTIINPISGTVLTKLQQENELTDYGRGLYKIADLSEMDLRVYVSGNQLSNIKIGQKAEILIDDDSEILRALEGTVSWIAATSEFTPKIIQTRQERINLVYAVKLKVQNDGTLKIGMPAEVNFTDARSRQ